MLTQSAWFRVHNRDSRIARPVLRRRRDAPGRRCSRRRELGEGDGAALVLPTLDALPVEERAVPERAPASPSARCREMIRGRLEELRRRGAALRRETREAAFLLYAWCRHCDDQIDGETLGFRTADGAGGGRRASAQRLERLLDDTQRALARRARPRPRLPGARSASSLRHAIPERYPLELLEGFAMDVEGRRYASPRTCSSTATTWRASSA